MHIAILMTNTDESDFAQQHPKDGEKFQALLRPLRPDWTFDVYPVKDAVFPETLDGIDGVIITGSPASVRSGEDWVTRLMDLIRLIAAQGIPMFGACFGHQAIAQALGGSISDNPGPFVLGVVETRVTHPAPWMTDAPVRLRVNAAHGEQVTRLPEGAQVLTSSAECPVGGFAIGDHVFTTEYHPEMTHGFITALVGDLDGDVDDKVFADAKASLREPADRDLFARWIVQFFENAPGARRS